MGEACLLLSTACLGRPLRARLWAAGNLAFPLLLVGGLFLLSRRSQGGPGGAGGNNPLAFGKSKAKFQMEPNTGITFDDVAGVDEAKQDFMEVRPCASCCPDMQGRATWLHMVLQCGSRGLPGCVSLPESAVFMYMPS